MEIRSEAKPVQTYKFPGLCMLSISSVLESFGVKVNISPVLPRAQHKLHLCGTRFPLFPSFVDNWSQVSFDDLPGCIADCGIVSDAG